MADELAIMRSQICGALGPVLEWEEELGLVLREMEGEVRRARAVKDRSRSS
jgi:hypothetical protein